MTAVAFLADPGNADGTLGGAELTMREFAAAAPDGVEIVGPVRLDEADAVVIGNCVTHGPRLVDALAGKRVVRYHNDLSRHEHPALREWLERQAPHEVSNVFTSPLHDQRYGGPCQAIIPPAIDLARFRPSHDVRNRLSVAVTVGCWQNPGKGGHLIAEWAQRTGTPVVAYGTGPFHPQGPGVEFRGPISQEQLPAVLWQHETFVHLPSAVEPFGRAVVEAWAAGCRLVVNELVGARYWIEERPEALSTASRDFWRLVVG